MYDEKRGRESRGRGRGVGERGDGEGKGVVRCKVVSCCVVRVLSSSTF